MSATKKRANAHPGFHALTPERILDVIEQAAKVSLSNLCRPLNSYINRVYELSDRQGAGLIAKFYRPGRWSEAALLDEHRFLLELAAGEIPVIPPLRLADGTTLGMLEGFHFALFPKKGGRYLDEFTEDQWISLGRLIGRMHMVGAGGTAGHRPVQRPDRLTSDQAEMILGSGLLPDDLARTFRQLCRELIATITPFFDGIPLQRIHGDCHFGNIIHRPEEGFVLIDFDDMAVGPPVQDLWMLLPGPLDECGWEVELFLEGYATFAFFDQGGLRLIEPLRAMRYIHYIAWCAHQVREDGRAEAAPDFGSRQYWQQEINDLEDQLQRIRNTTG